MYGSDFSFIEAPIHQGQKHRGVANGPAFLRRQMRDQQFSFKNFILSSEQDPKFIKLKPYQDLSYYVEQELSAGHLVFTSGGDHSLSLGSIQGALRFNPDIKVLWVDAHGDINTRASSMTGSFHGMPLAFLLGADKINQSWWFKKSLRPENLIYFGVRDLDPAESQYLEEHGIACYTKKIIESLGLKKVVQEILNELSGSQVLVSVDADAFDPNVAPSTGVPVANGLTYNEVSRLLSSVAQVSDVVSFEYVELNPELGLEPHDNERTAQLGIDLFKIVLEQYKYKAGGMYGSNDRQCYSKEPDLLYSHF